MKRLFLFILTFVLSIFTKAQTPICPPATICNNAGSVASAHVINPFLNIDYNFALSNNLNNPHRYFCLGDQIILKGTYSGALTSVRWDLIS